VLFATGGMDGRVIVWDLHSLKSKGRRRGQRGGGAARAILARPAAERLHSGEAGLPIDSTQTHHPPVACQQSYLYFLTIISLSFVPAYAR
jgi:hypothetical protein